jgi:hypothetical protein
VRRIVRASRLLPICCVSLLACAGDEGRQHVFTPKAPSRPGGVSASSPAAREPESEPGSGTPIARIASVRAVSTGAPVSLGSINESVNVLVLVARGRASSDRGPAQLELRLTGAHDTTLAETLSSPVPAVVAHSFHIPVGGSGAALRNGRHRAQVRLTGPDGALIVSSVPLELTVRASQP